jgi:hypothetical protein
MSPGAWLALAVGLMLGFAASWLAASRLRRRSRVEAQILAAAVIGGIPAVWIFTIAWALPGGGHVVGWRSAVVSAASSERLVRGPCGSAATAV